MIRTVGQCLFLFFFLFFVPVVAGTLFDGTLLIGQKQLAKQLFRWISGQLLLWAGFEVICVPLILGNRYFHEVVVGYSLYVLTCVCLAVMVGIRRKKNVRHLFRVMEVSWQGVTRRMVFLWAIFLFLFCLQLVQCVRLTYRDWDDAFYVATSTITVQSDTMYRILPYTGGTTDLDIRHALAPLPVWIAYLSQISGVHAATMSHVVIALLMIVMTYVVYALIGGMLYGAKSERFVLFLILIELLILFGNYSIYSAENFLIARSRQGKAAFCNLVIPFLFFLFLQLLRKIEQQKKVQRRYWVLFGTVMLMACLCTTMGAVLAVLLVLVTGLCVAVSYRNIQVLLPMGLCCLPCLVVALLYAVIR